MKINRKKKFGLVLLLVLSMILQVAGPWIDYAYADEVDPVTFNSVEIKHVDGDGNDVSGPFQINSNVKIRFSYSIVDGEQVDTTKVYSFTIPEELKIINTLPLILKDGERELANILVDISGTMTVIFLSEINNEDFEESRNGWIVIDSKFDEIKVGDGGEKTIDFEVNGNSKSVVVNFPVIDNTEEVVLVKSGDYNKTDNEITWTIKVKPTTTPSGGTIKNIVITDRILEGQTYVDGSAMLGGTVISPDPVSGGILTYTLGELLDGDDQPITFKTKPDLSKFVTNGVTIEFLNTVTGTFGEVETPKNIPEVTAEVTTKVDFITKTGTYDATNKKIKWTITINNNNLELPAGIEIKDTIGVGLKFNDDLVISPDAPGTFLEKLDNSFIFKFTNEIDKMHIITYSTNVIDPDAFNSNTPKKFYNQAEITWPNKPGGGTSTGEVGVGVGVVVTTNVISKTGVSYNASTHEVTWKIVVNSNNIKITDPIITDTLPVMLDYVSHTVSGSNTWDFVNNNNNLSFSHIGEINEAYTITLVTKIKDDVDGVNKKYFGDNSTKDIKNTAKLTGTGVQPSESEGNKKIVSEVIRKAAKGYDYVTRKAKWEIVVNKNNMPITNALVTDIIGDNHEFVLDSLKISGVTENLSSMYSISGKTITINLGNINQQTTITFETQIPKDLVGAFFESNGNKELKNNSSLTGTEINGTVKSNEATQKVKNTVVSKEGTYTSGNDFIDWTVFINLNELELNTVILEDILQAGLIFDPQSVEVKMLTIASDGKFSEGASKIIGASLDKATNKVTFDLGNIKEAYVLKFRTDIDDAYRNKTFNNSILLKGSNGDQVGNSSAIGVSFQTGDAGGSGTSTRGSLSVRKVDKENPDNTIYLEGAQFKLYKSDKTTLVETESITESDGRIVYNNLRMGTYFIGEIVAPEGYVLDK